MATPSLESSCSWTGFRVNWGSFLSREVNGLPSVESTDSACHKLVFGLPTILNRPFVGFSNFSLKSRAYSYHMVSADLLLSRPANAGAGSRKQDSVSLQGALCYSPLMCE